MPVEGDLEIGRAFGTAHYSDTRRKRSLVAKKKKKKWLFCFLGMILEALEAQMKVNKCEIITRVLNLNRDEVNVL